MRGAALPAQQISLFGPPPAAPNLPVRLCPGANRLGALLPDF